MKGGPLESTKRAVLSSVSKLNPEDTFNIIGFNGDTKLFSLSMVQANNEAITRATEWMDANLVANGGTNIMLPVEQVKLALSLPFIGNYSRQENSVGRVE